MDGRTSHDSIGCAYAWHRVAKLISFRKLRSGRGIFLPSWSDRAGRWPPRAAACTCGVVPVRQLRGCAPRRPWLVSALLLPVRACRAGHGPRPSCRANLPAHSSVPPTPDRSIIHRHKTVKILQHLFAQANNFTTYDDVRRRTTYDNIAYDDDDV